MLGGLLAGHDEGGGEIITRYYTTGEVIKSGDGYEDVIEERKFVNFYGMSSKAANEKHFGGLKEYRSSEGPENPRALPRRDRKHIQDLLGGVRSTCTYAARRS